MMVLMMMMMMISSVYCFAIKIYKTRGSKYLKANGEEAPGIADTPNLKRLNYSKDHLNIIMDLSLSRSADFHMRK